MRVSKADGSQVLDLQADALIAAGITERNVYSDTSSGKRDDRPGLDSCLKALRSGDTLVVWKLARPGRNLRHLVNVAHDLTERGVGLHVLTGHGAAIDTTTAAGKLVFGIFAALAEFERELISERTRAGLAAARARGRKGGRKPKMTPAKVRLAAAAMGQKGTVMSDLCAELGITNATIYRYVSPTGELRPDGKKVVGAISRHSDRPSAEVWASRNLIALRRNGSIHGRRPRRQRQHQRLQIGSGQRVQLGGTTVHTFSQIRARRGKQYQTRRPRFCSGQACS